MMSVCILLRLQVSGNTIYLIIISSHESNSPNTETPLQEKLNVLAGQIGNGGMLAAGATFVAMMTLWFLYPETHAPVSLCNNIVRFRAIHLV